MKIICNKLYGEYTKTVIGYHQYYPNITKEDKFNLLRKYDKETDWTRKRTDEELLDTIDKLITLSKEIEQDCLKHNIPFIDTSKDLIQDIEEALQNIKKEN